MKQYIMAASIALALLSSSYLVCMEEQLPIKIIVANDQNNNNNEPKQDWHEFMRNIIGRDGYLGVFTNKCTDKGETDNANECTMQDTTNDTKLVRILSLISSLQKVDLNADNTNLYLAVAKQLKREDMTVEASLLAFIHYKEMELLANLQNWYLNDSDWGSIIKTAQGMVAEGYKRSKVWVQAPLESGGKITADSIGKRITELFLKNCMPATTMIGMDNRIVGYAKRSLQSNIRVFFDNEGKKISTGEHMYMIDLNEAALIELPKDQFDWVISHLFLSERGMVYFNSCAELVKQMTLNKAKQKDVNEVHTILDNLECACGGWSSLMAYEADWRMMLTTDKANRADLVKFMSDWLQKPESAEQVNISDSGEMLRDSASDDEDELTIFGSRLEWVRKVTKLLEAEETLNAQTV